MSTDIPTVRSEDPEPYGGELPRARLTIRLRRDLLDTMNRTAARLGIDLDTLTETAIAEHLSRIAEKGGGA